MSADSISPRTTLPSPLATVFVVHANSDRDWVRGLLIPELGLQPGGVITPEDFTPGAPVVREFERAIAGARFTVLVLTEAFLADRWAEIGELLATHASVSGADRLIPILLEPCEIPLRVDFRVRLDCTEPHRWQSELARLRAVLGDAEPLAERIACPYPGMVAFGAHDAPFFYGREEESDTLVQRLRHHRMILVVGPSGSGKSSLIHGGLLPRLASSGGDRWLVRTMRPGAEPMQSLAQP
jgi:ABC-type multidrug transport system fused ATPase/permease subunit